MARFPNALRLAIVASAALASMATSSVQSGDRANGGDGDCFWDCGDNDPGPTCPADENCSDASPNGLYFGGTPTGDISFWSTGWPHITAVGGRQTIGLYLDSAAEQPLDLPYVASLSTSALSVADTLPAAVVVQGDSEGGAKLRIAEPDTDLLYDRIDVSAAPIERMFLLPAGEYQTYDFDFVNPEFGARFAVWTGGQARLTVAMVNADDDRVVNEGMTIDPAPGISADPEGFVNTVRIAPVADGSVNIAVRAGDAPVVHMAVIATSRAASIEPLNDSITLRVDAGGRLCFRARTSAGAYLMGADWSYTSSARLTLVETDDDVLSHCVRVNGTETGSATLTARAAGASVDLDVTIIDANRSRAAAPRAPAIEPALAGDRADNAAALAATPQP